MNYDHWIWKIMIIILILTPIYFNADQARNGESGVMNCYSPAPFLEEECDVPPPDDITY